MSGPRPLAYAFGAGYMANAAVSSWIWGRTGLLVAAVVLAVVLLACACHFAREAAQ